MARQRFQEGVRYFDAKQYDKARAAFLQAYALKKHPTVLLNLAQSELRSGHDAEAADHFSEFLRENKDAGSGERQSAEQGLTTAKNRVEEVSIAVDLPDAEVFVDNESRGHAPLPGPVYLAPGNHTLQARKEGKLATSTVTASAAQSVSVALNFSNAGRTTKPAEPPTSAKPPAPESGTPPPPPGGETSGAASAAVGEVDTHGFVGWYTHSPGAWVLSGVAVVGLGAGVGLAISARQNYKDADSVAAQITRAAADNNLQSTQGLCIDPAKALATVGITDQKRIDAYTSACQKYKDNVKRGDQMKTFSIVSFAVGGAAAVGTVVYYFVDRDPAVPVRVVGRPQPSVRVSPVVSPGFVGIAAVGSF